MFQEARNRMKWNKERGNKNKKTRGKRVEKIHREKSERNEEINKICGPRKRRDGDIKKKIMST